MAKLLKICCSEWRNASRDKRELGLCKEMGMEVLVLAKGKKGEVDSVDGFEVHRIGTRPLGSHIPNGINRALSVFQWAFYANKINPDIISGHDLSGLTIGYISCMFKRKSGRPKLVYDSHEYELGRPVRRSRLTLYLIRCLESFLIKRCAFSMMVNDCIADVVQSNYKLKIRPLVVLNTPNYWRIDVEETKKQHDNYCKTLGIPADSFIVMFHGGLSQGRGVEIVLDLISKNANIYGVILGNGEKKYLDSIHSLASDLKITNRVLFLPAVPISELWRYIGGANLGLIPFPALSENHRLALPNKFFENIQSETPIICSDYPAMGSIIHKYHCGETFDIFDMNELNKKVDNLRLDTDKYKRLKIGTMAAKKDLCWEKEKSKLYEAYRAIL